MSALAGRLALVTGASSGIGLAIAGRLAAAGMDLHLLARDSTRLQLARAQLHSAAPGISIGVQAVDLALSAQELHAALAEVDDQKLAVLVHSAGAYSAANLLDTSQQELEAMFRINVSSALALAQRFAKALENNQGQMLVVNSSVALQTAKAVPGAYAATKHAAKALTDGLRDAFNPRGIRVLSVYPGRTATPMQEAIFAAEGREYPAAQLLQSQDIAAVVQSALELPRTAEVTDISVRPMQKT